MINESQFNESQSNESQSNGSQSNGSQAHESQAHERQACEMNPLIRCTSNDFAARSSRGMTLIEIMVVVAIISLIMGGFGVVAFQRFQEAQLKTARNQAVQQQQLVEQYMLQKRGKCPKNWEDLKAAGISAKVVKDPWGNDFTLKCPGDNGPVDVTSMGPDGEPGTEDDIKAWEDELVEGDQEEPEQD